MARSSGSKRSEKDDSDSDSEDEVTDDLDSLRKENAKWNDLLDNRDAMLRDAKKQRKELRVVIEDSKDRVIELESKLLDARLKIDSLKTAPVVTDEIDCADCNVFLADLTALKEKHALLLEELDVLTIEVAELKNRPALLGACISCPVLHAKLEEA